MTIFAGLYNSDLYIYVVGEKKRNCQNSNIFQIEKLHNQPHFSSVQGFKDTVFNRISHSVKVTYIMYAETVPRRCLICFKVDDNTDFCLGRS